MRGESDRRDNSVSVDDSNVEQARSWDGDEGVYWTANADHFDRAVAAYHASLMSAASIVTGARVLDIGCGTGQTTREAARAAGSGVALGVDLSAQMIDLARHRAAEQGIDNALFEQADAQNHPFSPGSFDIAISRMGTMFFGDPGAAFANIGRAVRPGGRLAVVVWQGPEPNEWIRELSHALAAGRDLPGPRIGAPGPFAQADPGQVEAVLGAAGFSNIVLTPVRGAMWFGADAGEAHRFVCGLMGWMLNGLDQAGRQEALENLRATLCAHETGEGVVFDSAAWLIQATRRPLPEALTP
jgi:SAM-dependent methyltransferase